MNPARIRNLGIAAHIDAGKTTVSERLLFVSGVEHRIGEVDDGTATMDWMPEERERGITITAAATTLRCREYSLNLIDTPGHVDFTVEVERSLRVLDGAVLVIDAVAGVQAQSEAVWRQMRRHRVPAIAFVNKCDRAGADYFAALASIEKRLGAPAAPLHFPLFDDGHFVGFVDLLTQRAFGFSGPERDHGETPPETPIPAGAADEVGVLRSELIDKLADHDDELLKAVLDGREVELAVLKRALRRATLGGHVLPVLCGAALRNIGIEALLDAVIDYLPSPCDVPPVRGVAPGDGSALTRDADPAAPVAALAFKLHAEAHGDLTFLRVYSGVIRAGDALFNPRTRKHERINRVMRMHADSRTQLEEAGPGEIVAVTGPKAVITGDTLCDHAAPIVLEALVFPEPVISMVVEPRSTNDREKLRVALKRLAREDPTFHEREDESTGQWLIAGMGELHLEVMLHRLAGEHHVDAAMGKPRVAYRETVRRGTTATSGAGRVDRIVAGKEMFGAVELELLPAISADSTAAQATIEWSEACVMPRAFRASVQQALLDSAQVGPRFGFPLVGAHLVVRGTETHPRKDAEPAFIQAAAIALREATEAAPIDLLEPVMAFEIECPSEFAGGVIADLNARHAEVTGVESRGTLRAVIGRVPLAHMFGYSTACRSLTQGRASYSLRPAGFQVVPEQVLVTRGLVWT